MDQTPPILRHEKRRLSALRALGVLDTDAESFSESVVAAAAAVVNTPRSAITLVDEERQWFKGSCGLSIGETSRDISFCAHAIATPDRPLIVRDTWEDERFRDNPLVTMPPYIRFYAGFPLIVHGEAVGALCIMDDRPRTLTDAERQRLQELANGTAAWLAMRGRGDDGLPPVPERPK